ncbi:MAG: glycosyltransferase family 4 protein [Candidatus Tectomicrobia bacterium]|nr:glycosyltransferase family 4 protein [Candidatus Tectomicrobia bacterium]
MRIAFDARPLRHHWGRGVGQFWRGFFSHLLARDDKDEFVFHLTRGVPPRLEDFCPPGAKNGYRGRVSVRLSEGLPEELAWVREQLTLSRDNRRDRIDVWHCLFQRNVPLQGGKNIVAHVFDMMPIVNAPLYVEKRGGMVGAKIRLYEKYLKTALPRVCRIIAISEQTKRDIVEVTGAEAERVRVVHLAVEERFQKLELEGLRETVRELYDVPGPYLLYVGGIEYRKGCDPLLRAFRNIADRFRDLTLVMVGKTEGRYPERVLQMAADLGVEDRVIFTGFVPDEHLPILYNGAEVFVYPSSYEGFGLPVLEAMACGAPVVTTSATSIPEVAGEAALLVPPGDEEALAREIEGLLSDPERRREMGRRGIQRASHFTWDRVLCETLAVYQEVYRENR